MRRDKRKITYESVPFNLTALTFAPRDLRFFWSRGHLFVTIRPNGSGDKNEVLWEFIDVKPHKFNIPKRAFLGEILRRLVLRVVLQQVQFGLPEVETI